MCRPRLPCFTEVSEVAAQPAKASAAKAIKKRFIPVLKRLRRMYGMWVPNCRWLWLFIDIPIRNRPRVTFTGSKHLLNESQLLELVSIVMLIGLG